MDDHREGGGEGEFDTTDAELDAMLAESELAELVAKPPESGVPDTLDLQIVITRRRGQWCARITRDRDFLAYSTGASFDELCEAVARALCEFGASHERTVITYQRHPPMTRTFGSSAREIVIMEGDVS